MPEIQARPVTENTFATFDGTELFYRHWPAQAPEPRGAIVMLHRGHEHSGRMAHIPDELNLPDFSFFAWDARGNGRSPGPRGDSPGVDASIRDVDAFVRHLSETYAIPMENIVVLAQSVGAVLAAAWAHDYAPGIRALILGSPAFGVKLYVPFARQGIALWQKIRGNFFVNSYVKAHYLTHDPARVDSFKNDPLITRPISARMLTGLLDTGDRIVDDAGAITMPVQLFISGADWVVRHRPQHVFYNRLNGPFNERHVMPEFFHDTFGEKEREKVYSPMRAFIEKVFAMAPYRPDLSRAHLQSPSATRQKWLESPYPPMSPKGLCYALAVKLLRFPGRLSDGVKLGLETGFDSGSTLDYVYRNSPSGSNFLGRLIDRVYLNSPGWTGIRVRREQLEETLLLAAKLLREKGLPVRVMDIAAGHGRYIVNALKRMDGGWESALLRDYSPANMEKGEKLIRDEHLAGKARFELGDAFDGTSIAAVEPKPTLAVVSGLYELFPDNALLRESLKGIAAAVPAGGFLAYTNQPWHPQQEYIARVLTSHRQGASWVMRCRSQQEMDQLVADAGFAKISQLVDPQGIFTVSLAVRTA